jgi:perosamine synthetase
VETPISQAAPIFDEDEMLSVVDVVQRKWLTEGPRSAQFIEAIKAETGARHAVLAPNGTLGLFLAMLALDLPRGSEIIIPSFTFYASASAAVFAGLRPVFVDVDADTFNLDVNALDAVVSKRTSAIMPVHIYGHAAPVDTVVEFARRHRLRVIEDAAQAYSVAYRGRHAGTWGDVGVISFFADKTFTTGEGGVVLTDDDHLYRRLRLLRNQGRLDSGTFVHDGLGMNFRITDLQSAIGLAQLRKLPQIVAAKRRNFERYVMNLRGVEGVRWMRVEPGADHVPFRFPLISTKRDALVAALETLGVQTRTFFYPLHWQPALQVYRRGPLPITERLYEHGICLPVHADLSESDIDRITDTIRTVHSAEQENSRPPQVEVR